MKIHVKETLPSLSTICLGCRPTVLAVRMMLLRRDAFFVA
jgi:hypothetical protein